jgi:hypothetical protein
MNHFLALEVVALTLALLCAVLVPFAIHNDPGFSRRIVPMDAIPPLRWPNLLTRVGAACLLGSFALLVLACYYILAGAPY